MVRKTPTLVVIAGPMFSGKTEELIRQVKRAVIGKKNVQVFKHAIDTRYGDDKKLHSHAGIAFESNLVRSAEEILAQIDKKTEIVAIDEAQWFGPELVQVVETLLAQKKNVIVSGLAMTFDRKPFEPVPTLMAMADRVLKLSAVCAICGNDAVFHKRIAKAKNIDALMADPSFVSKLDLSVYQARCRNCYNKR
jgi:thymidine kinase